MGAVAGTSVAKLTALQTSSLSLRNALHDIAQPLTTLAALLDATGQPSNVVLGGDALVIARSECQRAIAMVRSLQLRATADGEMGGTQ